MFFKNSQHIYSKVLTDQNQGLQVLQQPWSMYIKQRAIRLHSHVKFCFPVVFKLVLFYPYNTAEAI